MDPWIGSSTAPNASGFSSNHSNASSADNINAVSANRISLQPRPASAGVVSPPSWSPAPLPSLSQQLQHDPSAASSFATAAPEDRREEPLASFPPTSLSHPDPARKHPAFTGSSLARPGSEFDRSYPSLPHSDDIGPTDTGPAYMSSADERRHIRPASSQHTPDPYYKLQSNSPRPYIAGEGFPGTPVASRSRMDPSPVSTPGHPRFLPRQSESNETSPSERRDPYRSYDSAADDSSLSPGFMHPIKSSSSSAASSPLPSGLRRPIDSRLSSGAPLHAASHEDLSGASIDSSGSVHGLGRPGPEPDSHFSNAFRPWASTPDKSFPTFKDERYSQGSPVYRSDRMSSSDSLHSASGPIKTDAHTHPAESPSPFDSRAYSSEWDHRPSQREPFKDISLPGLGPHHSDTPVDSRFREEQPSERPKGSEVDRTRYDPGPYGSQYATAPAHTHGEDTTSSASSHRWSSSRQYPSEAQLLGRPARPYSIPGDQTHAAAPESRAPHPAAAAPDRPPSRMLNAGSNLDEPVVPPTAPRLTVSSDGGAQGAHTNVFIGGSLKREGSFVTSDAQIIGPEKTDVHTPYQKYKVKRDSAAGPDDPTKPKARGRKRKSENLLAAVAATALILGDSIKVEYPEQVLDLASESSGVHGVAALNPMLTVRLDGEGGAAAKLGRPAKPAADKPKKSLLPMVMPTEDLSKYYNPPVKADPDAEKAREKRPRSEPGLLAEIPVQKRERLTTDGAGAEVADISSDADLNDIDEELTPEIKAQYAGALTKYMARLRHRQNQALQRMRNKEKEIRQAAFQRFLAELETVEIERARQKRLADEVMAQKAAAEAAAMAAAEAAASAAAEAAAAATAVAHAIRSQKGKVGKGSRGYRSGFGDGLRSDDEGSQVPTRPSTPLRPESSVVPERDRIWQAIVSKGIPRVHKMLQQSVITRMSNCRKVAQMCAKEAIRADRAPSSKDFALRCRRANREMILFWKRNEREERELRKKAEKDALERRRQEEEAREARRQARKLNFLITQTELYSHFIGRKIDKGSLDDASGPSVPTDISQIDFDTADEQNLQDHARVNAANALFAQQQSTRAFDEAARFRRAEAAQVSHGARPGTAIATDAAVDHMDFLNPSSLRMDSDVTQPRMITCSLKAYQLKGLNWLANLYEQGINGILADEMGLGKTVQAISLMAHLAEVHNIWGPFLVISPSSTLHNWQQEITKFAPDLKVLPYWGMAKDRKVLRQFWNSKRLYGRDAPFHVLVTSYNLVATDEKYFQRIKWQYMILDEAQAIKSSQSARWKILLGFKCRNRLLLTGTPIQNSMQELWALLHFIMPTLFDSHEEFSEWFSKDIESHAENKSTLNEHQLKRLHMILKPFMLRRVKKDVENELAEKLEVEVICYLSPRQRHIYRGLKEKISVADLLEKVQLEAANSAPGSVSGSLMNLVMQFRKVCNHPELFERADVESPFVMFPPDQIQFSQGSAADGPRWVTYNLVGGLRYRIPKQLYRAGLALVGALSSHPKQSVIDHLFNIWLPLNSVESAEMQVCRLVGLSLSELHKLQSGGLPYLWRYYQCWIQARRLGLLQRHGIASAPASAHQVLALVPACQGFDLTSDAYSLDILSIVKHSVYWRFFTQQYTPKVISAYAEISCSDRSFAWEHNDLMFNRNHVSTLWRDLSSSMLLGVSDPSEDIARPASDLSHDYIKMPERNRLISDAGKMVVLDSMLPRLRKEGHRVLIFFQMVKMMDLMEEYLIHRKYMYLRLDGSTDMNDRKSRVTDWQTKPEIFVFLLSTRAGGLGINLTAADTVIFYDSDWNPTVDQQAMDRAHRLGQTKQVTVYRLITSATIEERILMRAKQKDEIQKVVISGGEYQQQVDFKPKEVLSLLLGEDELEETLRREELKRKASSAAMASGTSADATPRASLPSKPESKPKGAAKPRTPREPKTRKPAAQRGKSGATAYSDLGSSNGAATTPSGINVGEDQALGVGSNGALESSATSEAPASLPEPVKAARAPKTPKEAKPTRAPRTPKSKAVAGTSPAPPSNGSSGDGAAPLSTPANPSSAMDVDP